MEINQYLTELNDNTRSVLELTRKYSGDALTFKKEDECSIADILEHICISDRRTFDLLKSDSEIISPTTELYGDGKLKKIVVDYKGGPKITETEIRELQGIITDFSSFGQVFSQQRDLLQNGLKSGEIAVSNKVYKHLYLGGMTVTDWLKYIIYHTDRHLNDIKDSAMEFKKWMT
jgi:hypothetical protein